MGGIVAIDPGKHQGWALYLCGELTACGLGDPILTVRPSVAVVELPQVYRQSKMKGDPNDLIRLAFDAGRRVERLADIVETFKPSEWKGQVPKEIHHPRILAELYERERDEYAYCVRNVPKSYQHNVLDAVGLGLWYVKKIGARR